MARRVEGQQSGLSEDERLVQLQAENAQLRAENAQLKAAIAQLRAELLASMLICTFSTSQNCTLFIGG